MKHVFITEFRKEFRRKGWNWIYGSSDTCSNKHWTYIRWKKEKLKNIYTNHKSNESFILTNDDFW